MNYPMILLKSVRHINDLQRVVGGDLEILGICESTHIRRIMSHCAYLFCCLKKRTDLYSLQVCEAAQQLFLRIFFSFFPALCNNINFKLGLPDIYFSYVVGGFSLVQCLQRHFLYLQTLHHAEIRIHVLASLYHNTVLTSVTLNQA